MHPATSVSFKSWLKAQNNTKLISDAAVTRVNYEEITNCESLTDFDKMSIDYLLRTCKEIIPATMEDCNAGISTETEVHGTNIGSISVHYIIVAFNATK